MSHRSTLHQASAQPCYLLPTFSPGRSPGAHLSWVPSRTCQPAPTDRPSHPPAPGTPPTPYCPACTCSVSGCAGASIPTSGLTPAIPHPAAAPGSAAPQDPPAPQVKLQQCANTVQILYTYTENQAKLIFVLLQKNPGANSPEPSSTAFRLWVFPSTPCSPANGTAAAVPGRRHWLVSHCHGINESPAEMGHYPIVLSLHPYVCHIISMMGDNVNLITCLSSCRDLSVDAGLPHHQYQLQHLPQHYQHYLASPRMHHFPRNTSSAQMVCLIQTLPPCCCLFWKFIYYDHFWFVLCFNLCC